MMLSVKKIITLTAVTALLTTPALALGPKTLGEMPEKAGSRPGLLNKTFAQKGRAAIGSCTLTQVNGTTITCTSDSKTYTVLTDANTQFRRRFWGKAALSEFQTNDILIVIGSWTDDAHTTIQARMVRDTSIQKRSGTFFGTVTSLTADGWVMSTINRGNQTVSVTGTTKFINRREQTITKADIAVGNRVRVRGLWDNKNSTITAVTKVKDFSIPPLPTGGLKPSPTVTVAPSATPTP